MRSARRPQYIAMSFHRLFLGGLLPSRARLRFAGRTDKYNIPPSGSIFARRRGPDELFLRFDQLQANLAAEEQRSISREATDGCSGAFLNEAIRHSS